MTNEITKSIFVVIFHRPDLKWHIGLEYACLVKQKNKRMNEASFELQMTSRTIVLWFNPFDIFKMFQGFRNKNCFFIDKYLRKLYCVSCLLHDLHTLLKYQNKSLKRFNTSLRFKAFFQLRQQLHFILQQ